MTDNIIRKHLASSICADMAVDLSAIIYCDKNKAEIKVKYTLSERFNPSDIEKARKLYSQLADKDTVITLQDILDM